MKVLINRTDAIGDCLLSTPLARLIKDKVEGARVIFLVSPRSGELLKISSGIDEVYVYDPSWSLFKRLSFVRDVISKESPDHFIHLGGKVLPIFAAWTKKIPFRGGLKSKIATFLFLNKGIRQSRRLVTMHESDYNLEIAQSLGISSSGSRPPQYAPVLNVDSQKATNYRNELGVKDDEKLIVIHPGMSGHTLNWSSRNYGRLIKRLIETEGINFKVFVTYTPSDGPYLEGLKDFLSKNNSIEEQVTFFDGSIKGLLDFTIFLKGADLFIGPSTGTTHMANALGVPQVSIYSPIKVQSNHRWGPYHQNDSSKVIIPDVVCGESTTCAGASCPYYECMSKIEVEEVYRCALEIVNNLEKA